MTPTELATRLATLDWSGCSLQHQLAINAAVVVLDPSRRVPCKGPGAEVIALVPKGARREAHTVRLLTLDGHHMVEKSFQAGRASAPWSWIAAEVAKAAGCAEEVVGCAEAEAGDFVTVDGIPYCRVAIVGSAAAAESWPPV